MATLLDWRPYDKSADHIALQGFTCTVPAIKVIGTKRRHHPKPWEREVQSVVHASRPNPSDGEFMILGHELDGHGIGAVCRWVILDHPGEVLLQIVAVARRHRGADGAHAAEAIGTAISQIASNARAAESHGIYIEALIHKRNEPSKRMCRNAGFKPFGEIDAYEKWGYSR